MVDKVVLTGMRTTGVLHLGHYVGALKQWIDTQNANEYTCYFLLADVQALTTHVGNPALLTRSIREVVLDWLSVGLDPTRPNIHFVQQSQVYERYELSILLGMIAKYKEVMRDPTLKSELERQEDASMGFLYYPVDQIADIQMVDPMTPGAELLVPVGEDQLPHLELAREVVRDFNNAYGSVFTECQGLVGKIGRLVGTDGDAKMSKSMGNTINLTDDDATVANAISHMAIDPARAVRGGNTIPGDPDKCVAIVYLQALLGDDSPEVLEIRNLYSNAQVGDRDIKQRLNEVMTDFLAPIRSRRMEFEHEALGDIVYDGTQAARRACVPVVEAVREKMHLVYP